MSEWRAAIRTWSALCSRYRWPLLGTTLVVLVVATIGVALPKWVEAQVVERIEGRGLKVEVGATRVGFGKVWLLDWTVEDPQLEEARVRVSAVAIDVGLGRVRELRVSGIQGRIVGDRAQLLERWRSFRGRGSGRGEEKRDRDGLAFSVEGIDVHWRIPQKGSVLAWGVSMRGQLGGAVTGEVDLVRVDRHGLTGEARSMEVSGSLADGLRVQRVEVARAQAQWMVDEWLSAQAGTARAADADASANAARAGAAAGGTPGLGRLDRLREVARKHLAEDVSAQVVALTLEVTRAGEALRVGPSRVQVTRAPDELRVEMASHSTDGGGTPLELKARLALKDGSAEVELTGGPVSLATLGVRERDFGLVGVRDARLAARAKLSVDAGGGNVELTSEGRLENVRLFRPAIAPRELSGIGFGWRVEGDARLDGSQIRVERGELMLGEVRVEVRGEVEQAPERTRLILDASVPLAACGALLEALPQGIAPLLSGVRLSGTFGLKAHVSYDTNDLKATEAELDVKNDCRLSEVPEQISPARFRKSWLREVKGVGGLMQVESGPGSADWTSYEDISPHMETAILVCEDEGFFRHRGFAWAAIENSLQQNLMEGRFFRGGSTVTMQLAKNLYLGREKTISRKLQEAVLTLLLEQELSKHEIMELYLNVIEFGPGIYGIGQAAPHYFQAEPRDLSLGQALYLASILPNPDAQHFAPDGRVTPKWSAYLRKLMTIAHKIRRISDEELEEGLAEEVAFRRPAARRDDGDLGGLANDEEEPSIPELQ